MMRHNGLDCSIMKAFSHGFIQAHAISSILSRLHMQKAGQPTPCSHPQAREVASGELGTYCGSPDSCASCPTMHSPAGRQAVAL